MDKVMRSYVIEGYGASYRRDLDCWIVYSMPRIGDSYPEVCRVMGPACDAVDNLLATLRSSLTMRVSFERALQLLREAHAWDQSSAAPAYSLGYEIATYLAQQDRNNG